MKCCLLLARSRTATTSARRSRSIATRHLYKEHDGDAEGRLPFDGTKDGGKRRSRPSESDLVVQARHTLRAILRECSYLPDPSSRTYLAQHALARFRVYRLRSDVDHEKPETQYRLQMQHQQARKALNQLRRANDGELGPLYKTLALTYGRVGKRRHELMQPLLPAEGQRVESIEDGSGEGDSRPAAQKGTEPEQPPIGRKRNTKPVPELTPQLRALLSSQLSASPPAISRSELHQTRTLKPQIPDLNSWMRPMPKVRVANMTRRWYAEVLNRVLPPLPLREWNMLRDLAIGKQTPSPSLPRRRAAGAQRQLRERRISKSLEDLVLFNKIAHPQVADRDVHAITPRFMQRMYAKLFSECSLMEWHDGQWKVTWGHNAMVPGHGRL